MVNSLCILGRQPALGLAELESLYGADQVAAVGSQSAGLLLNAAEVDFSRLGGSTRLAEVLGEIESTDPRMIEKGLTGLVRSSAFAIPTSGKFHLGMSAIDLEVTPAKLNALGLTLKKIIRARHDGAVRVVPNQTAELSSAQVYHNHLVGEHGAELLLIRHNKSVIVARTTAVQDIDSYTLRDRGRPKRDARVGMLPPKLAQIIINLASGNVKAQESKRTLLDPFCGTGVVLQEALLMGYDVYGTDLEPRMISYTKENLAWLSSTAHLSPHASRLEVGDATTHQWDLPQKSVVACETYLGRPFTETPSPQLLGQTMSDVNLIIKKFLSNINRQIAPGTRLCLAVPAWFTGREVKHLPLLQNLSELGYKRVAFSHVLSDELIYHREGQIVGRELVVLEKP